MECGTKYHVYVVAKNAVGTSAPSSTVEFHTIGGVPNVPDQTEFIKVNVTQATIFTQAWKPRGCLITYFSLEYKNEDQMHWVQGIK